MKIRSGFISNSSTSSFVLVGLKVDEQLEENCKQYANENNIDCFDNHDFNIYEFASYLDLQCYSHCCDDSSYNIGMELSDGDEDYLDYNILKWSEVIGDEKIKKLLEASKKNIDDISIIIGTRES